MTRRHPVTVVGIGDDGCLGLSARAFNAIKSAHVLVGGKRHLGFFPDFFGRRLEIKSGFKDLLLEINELANEHTIVVLASGDPLFFGIGQQIINAVGSENCAIIPAPSSLQWAFAKAQRKWDDWKVLTLHGRPINGFVNRLKRYKRVGVLTDHENTPQRIAHTMLEFGESNWQATVLENLCGPDETVGSFSLNELSEAPAFSNLNIVLLERTEKNWRYEPTLPFLPEESYAKRKPKLGLITKKEIRLLSLAHLNIRRDSIVWDIGAGSGSVAIEAAKIAYEGRCFAIECDPEGVAICCENRLAHGVDNLTVIQGMAPEALDGLEAPDAIFVGGSKGQMRPIITRCLTALAPGGRLVINAITLDNVTEAYQSLRELNLWPEISLVNLSRGIPLAEKYIRYEALNPIHIFTVEKAH